MTLVLVLGLLACDDSLLGVPADGTLPVEEDDGGTGGASAAYHPDGFSDPSQHGAAAKAQTERCVSCHGEDLTGAGEALSCDTCHAEGWRTDCTFCHGGTDDATGAPPVYLAGDTEGAYAGFWSHGSHMGGVVGAPVACETCHTVPTDVLSPGHVFVDDRTPAEAEVAFSGLAQGGAWSGTGCSNLYCHGTGQEGAVGGINADATDLRCGTCHAGPGSSFAEWGDRMSGKHFLHLGEGVACAECHADSVDADGNILDPATHVDGVTDLRLPDGMEVVGEDSGLPVCAGTCHVNDHEHLPDRLWKR
jgi:predicted CxxxxCH...CXXCH cytochrome family protein